MMFQTMVNMSIHLFLWMLLYIFICNHQHLDFHVYLSLELSACFNCHLLTLSLAQKDRRKNYAMNLVVLGLTLQQLVA
uniref:Putative product n=1 Tax=Xenopsylla cheopis TaxID=163159 RepID=A0A6M2DQL8_XENCH